MLRRDIDWLDAASLPSRVQGAFRSMVFTVPCGGEDHVVRWSADGGATTDAHDEAEWVVGALGGDTPTCVRLCQFMNAGVLAGAQTTEGEVLVSARWDVRNEFADAAEAGVFASALREVENPMGVLLRGSTTTALSLIVRQSLVAWLEAHGLAVSDDADIRVVVSSRVKGAWGNVDKVVFDDDIWAEPLVGMQLTVGAGVRTRAVVCVTESWLDEVRDAGVVRGGRFFLGHNTDGPVYGHLEILNPELSAKKMIGGWAKLNDGTLDALDTTGLVEAATEPPPDEQTLVGSFRDWSHDGQYYRSEEGVHPMVLLGNIRDGLAWQIITDFLETFVHLDTLAQYAPAVDMETIDGFDVMSDDVRALLRCVVRVGENPFYVGLPSASVDPVTDQR